MRKHWYHWFAPLSVVGLLVITAIASGSCGANDVTNANQIVFPDTNVSFNQQVFPYMELACDQQGCHYTDNPAGGISLNSFGDVRTIKVVDQPGDTNCLLCRVIKLQDPNHIVPITPTPNQQRGIIEWVREGAKDN